jgi:hypothetical protein
MRPNFLVIGAMKCATSTLWAHLNRHPQIFMASEKEPGFFCRDEVFARGWEWYESLFAGAEGKQALGEATNGYSMQMRFPMAARRIGEHLSCAKLIYIVRHPLQRIESHWRNMLILGHDTPFDDLLSYWPDAVDTSSYWRQISAYRSHFPDEQILVLFYEELVTDADMVLKRCFDFLGVEPLPLIDAALAVNVSSYQRIDGSLIRLIRNIPGVELLKQAAPQFSRAVGARLRRPMPDRPVWPAALRRQVIAQLAPDTAAFLGHYGKPAGWWQFD